MIYSSYPAYTEDISVAGSLLRDKISVLYESLIRGGRRWSDDDTTSPSKTLFKVSNVELVDRLCVEPNIVGTLHVTTSHVIFRSISGTKELWIANGLIGSVERGSLSAAGCPLVIRCKHFQVINLLIGRDKICQDLYETLLRCSKVVNVNELAAFENRDLAEDARGWSRLDWAVEFTRQGVDGEWAENDLNESYRSCDTYPERLWLPISANKTILLGSCRFRSRGRLPVLTYFHKPNGAAICRCAQPLTGFSARCVEDEKLMELIGKANKNCDTLFLVDTRPLMNAMVNKVQGKGFEDERNYSNTRFYFFDIENIHVMRTSQLKLLEACTKSRTMGDYLRSLEASGWLKHLRAIVDCSTFLAESISKGISCVVHCSDGWDRTSQTVSLAQLLLDPFFRTIHGFQVLIEKDWLGFGHKFDDRCAHIGALNDEAAKEISPIFSQFLDCVHQIMRQRPRAFQFNDRYLIDIHEHVYSCQFGTFIGNCEKDRKDLQLGKRTKSLWTYLDLRQDDYFNPFYEPTTFSVLSGIDTRASAFNVWHALYNRFDDGLLPREAVVDTVMTTMEHIGVLESHIAALRIRIAELKCYLGRGGACCGNSMADSGHSSGTGQSEERLAPDQRPPSRESGIYDQGMAYSEEVLTRLPVRWQSLRDASHCTSKSCNAEFASSVDRRIHCHRCGKVFCRRCVRVTSDERERICEGCRGVS
ncbi:Myotubularin- protein 6 [Parelaphostrongylus tenuis]|uniref:phosphatidylinositol-3,5-bisphosphate 3-phosphatase n=1 Tax=Parelaphostrongylus tenuis TaxID=148309 RepID=A0AAD5R6W7_PARTN|nr:Myotubularin- protein 6 [Parelaphostrongylus tenuis]